MRLVGIDPSLTRTGVCILDGNESIFASIGSSRTQSTFARQCQILVEIDAILQKGDVVILEDFGISARFAPSGKFCERIELCGMIKLCVSKKTSLPWLSISPSMLKSFATGKAFAHKGEVLEAIESRWGVTPANNDEGDAFVLARYAQAVFGREPNEKTRIKKFLAYSDNTHKVKVIEFQNRHLHKNFSVL